MQTDVSERIVTFRRRKGYSQYDMAQLLGINRTTYAYREKQGSFSPEMLRRLADLLDITYNEILEEEVGLDPTNSRPSADLRLTPTEKALVRTFRALPDDERKSVFDFINDLRSK